MCCPPSDGGMRKLPEAGNGALDVAGEAYQGEDSREELCRRHLLELGAAMAAHKVSLEEYCSRFSSVVEQLPSMDETERIYHFCQGLDLQMEDTMVYRIYGTDGKPTLEKAIHVAHMLHRSRTLQRAREAREARARLPAELATACAQATVHAVHEVPAHAAWAAKQAKQAYSAGQLAFQNLPPVSLTQVKGQIAAFYGALLANPGSLIGSSKNEAQSAKNVVEQTESEAAESESESAFEAAVKATRKPAQLTIGSGSPLWVNTPKETRASRSAAHFPGRPLVPCR